MTAEEEEGREGVEAERLAEPEEVEGRDGVEAVRLAELEEGREGVEAVRLAELEEGREGEVGEEEEASSEKVTLALLGDLITEGLSGGLGES